MLISVSILRMKDTDQTPLIVNSPVEFNQEFVRNSIANHFQNRCEQVSLSIFKTLTNAG